MSQKDDKAILGFTAAWFETGVLTEEGLEQYAAAYERSQDKHAEHYRYGAFRRYLGEHRPLSAAKAEELYALGASDSALSGAIRADIVDLPECPASVTAQAIASGDKHLVTVAQRRLLLSELQTSPLTPELFQRCLARRDSAIQRFLLAKIELTQSQAQALAEQGASRAARNLAAERLRPYEPVSPALKCRSTRRKSLRD